MTGYRPPAAQRIAEEVEPMQPGTGRLAEVPHSQPALAAAVRVVGHEIHGDEAAGRADYALFGTPDLDAIGNLTREPDVIIEAKSLNVVLEEHVEQLRRYVGASPRMHKGVAVLTNGREWWLYDLERRGAFPGKRIDPINFLAGNPREAALILNEWLDRRRFG